MYNLCNDAFYILTVGFVTATISYTELRHQQQQPLLDAHEIIVHSADMEEVKMLFTSPTHAKRI